MWFPAAIIISTLLTLSLIFGVYKIFLDKPAIDTPHPGTTTITTPETSINPNQQASALPKPEENSPTPHPSPNSLKTASSTTGSIIPITTQSQTAQSGSSLSGTLFVNGSPPSGTSVVIAVREHGSNNASQVVQNSISPQTGSTWSWNGGTLGKIYDVVAVLKGKSNGQNIDYAQSPTYNLTVPTTSFGLTINIGYLMAAPDGTITTTCNTHNSNNTWAATVNFPQVNGAQYYWLQVGSTSGGNEIADIAKNAQTQEVTLNDSVSYFAKYAVSSVSNPTSVQYSDFSSPTTIKCP